MTRPSLVGKSTDSYQQRRTNRRKNAALQLEALEERKVLAAYINEIYFDPPASGFDLSHEYIELRGTPSMSLDDYYLIFLENENDALDTGTPGRIERIFDLNGESFGSNGFLTLRQKDPMPGSNDYTVAPGTTDLVNSGSGTGWGSGASSSLATEGEDPDKLENSGFTAMLISTVGHVPALGEDLDVGHDGLDVPTGHADWTIHDAIGIHSEAGEEDFGRLYAQINFGPGGPTNIELGATYVALGYEVEYIGRYGNSTGQAAVDWHISNLTDNGLSGYTAMGDFRQSGDPHGAPTFVETNQGVPYGTNLTNTLGAPNYPGVVASSVVARNIFYNQSAFDGNNASITVADDAAIAIDKTAYLPGAGLAVFANITSYSRGINGIMVDLSADASHAGITANDFVFKVGANNSPDTWSLAPAPSAVSVRMGAGVSGSDRVEITWANSAIQNQWLEVGVRDNANTNLTSLTTVNTPGGPVSVGDVFFFGNRLGDTGSPTATSFTTTTADASTIIAGGLGGAGGITNVRDIDRSNTITVAGDRAAALGNIGALNRLTVGTAGPFAPESGDAGIASALAATAGGAEETQPLPVAVVERLPADSVASSATASYVQLLEAAVSAADGDEQIATEIVVDDALDAFL